MNLYIKKKNVGVLMALILGLLILLFLYEGLRPQDPPLNGFGSKQQPAVFAAALRGVAIIIRNDNTFDWTDTRITIAQANKLYFLQAGTISKGDTRGFLLSEFATGAGEPLDHITYKPALVSISAHEAAGTVQVK